MAYRSPHHVRRVVCLSLIFVGSSSSCSKTHERKEETNAESSYKLERSVLGGVETFDATAVVVKSIGGDADSRLILRAWLTSSDLVLQKSACRDLPAAALQPLVDHAMVSSLAREQLDLLWSRSRELGARSQQVVAEVLTNASHESAFKWDASNHLCGIGQLSACVTAAEIAYARCRENTGSFGLGFGLGTDLIVAVVCQNSTASRLGLKEGDYLEKIGPYQTTEFKQTEVLIALFQSEREVTVVRDGRRRVFRLP